MCKPSNFTIFYDTRTGAPPTVLFIENITFARCKCIIHSSEQIEFFVDMRPRGYIEFYYQKIDVVFFKFLVQETAKKKVYEFVQNFIAYIRE